MQWAAKETWSPPTPMPHAMFVMIKGYHLGSLWLAEAFSRIDGCALYFEYEHCMRKLVPAWQQPRREATKGQPRPIVGANATLNYLRTSCTCSSTVDKLRQCTGCQNQPGSGSVCVAAGISLGATGEAFIQHIVQLRVLEPKIHLLVQVRSNHVKHAISFLRTGCGSPNHQYKTNIRPRMYIPPAVLLERTRVVASVQYKMVQLVEALAKGAVAYTLVYEAMQGDLHAEIAAILRAFLPASLHVHADAIALLREIGVPVSSAAWAKMELSSQTKAGAEAVNDSVVNFAEIEQAFRPMACLHEMLVAVGPVVFPLHACAAALQPLGAGPLRLGSGRKPELNASECGSFGSAKQKLVRAKRLVAANTSHRAFGNVARKRASRLDFAISAT